MRKLPLITVSRQRVKGQIASSQEALLRNMINNAPTLVRYERLARRSTGPTKGRNKRKHEKDLTHLHTPRGHFFFRVFALFAPLWSNDFILRIHYRTCNPYHAYHSPHPKKLRCSDTLGFFENTAVLWFYPIRWRNASKPSLSVMRNSFSDA